MTLSIGSSACYISLSQIRKYGHVIVEWYISDDKDLYHKFFDNKDAIETEMGVQLEWNELPEKKASRILVCKAVDFDNKEKWSDTIFMNVDKNIKICLSDKNKKYLEYHRNNIKKATRAGFERCAKEIYLLGNQG